MNARAPLVVASVLTMAVTVWLVYFVIEVASRLNVWPW